MAESIGEYDKFTAARPRPRRARRPARRSSRSRRRRPSASCDGQTIATDGPFAETKEALGGFYLVEAAGPRRGDRATRR